MNHHYPINTETICYGDNNFWITTGEFFLLKINAITGVCPKYYVIPSFVPDDWVSGLFYSDGYVCIIPAKNNTIYFFDVNNEKINAVSYNTVNDEGQLLIDKCIMYDSDTIYCFPYQMDSILIIDIPNMRVDVKKSMFANDIVNGFYQIQKYDENTLVMISQTVPGIMKYNKNKGFYNLLQVEQYDEKKWYNFVNMDNYLYLYDAQEKELLIINAIDGKCIKRHSLKYGNYAILKNIWNKYILIDYVNYFDVELYDNELNYIKSLKIGDPEYKNLKYCAWEVFEDGRLIEYDNTCGEICLYSDYSFDSPMRFRLDISMLGKPVNCELLQLKKYFRETTIYGLNDFCEQNVLTCWR